MTKLKFLQTILGVLCLAVPACAQVAVGTLSSGVNDTTLTLPYTQNSNGYLPSGTVAIDNERMIVCSATTTSVTVCGGGRGANSTIAVSHLSGATLYTGTSVLSSNTSGSAYPGAGVPNSTGAAWATSYTTSGSGTVLALTTSPTFITPALGVPSALTLTNALGLPLSGLTTQAADTVVQNATGGTAVPTAVAMPTCTSGADLYNTTTHAWSCVSGSNASLISKNTSYTIVPSDQYIVCDTRSAAVTLTLDASPSGVHPHWIKNIGSFACTVNGNGNTIDGSSTYVLPANSQQANQFVFDSATASANGWRIF